MSRKPVIKGLYAITPDLPDTSELLRKARLALQGGAQVLQYRNKSVDATLRLHQAQALRQLSREFEAIFIVNDDVQLAIQVHADGVHLGSKDGSATMARSILGKSKIIGVSCYNLKQLAQGAAHAGADYVAFGAFYPSSIKPDAVRAEPEILAWARRELNIAIVAIGGITHTNGAVLVQAGADALAVISAVFDVEDIRSSAQEFSTLISKARHDIAQPNSL